MTALAEARAHLSKAREFLEAGRFGNDLHLFNAATSDAVIAGINAKDAICLRLTGTTRKADGHQEAVAELRSSGPAGKELSSTLGRLLRMKTKSQYQSASMAAADAAKALQWAERLVQGAGKVVSSR